MSSDLSPLVADDGELRLARRVASYVYGRREVTWPEGVDDPEDDLPDEREFGWVAKLPGPEPGLSERRFVRGDVQIDAVEQVSNVEQVLDDAASRAGGDVFFESLIEGRGLGRLVPGRDFDEGDLVDVRFWGRVLPDQLVTAVEWHDGVPSVKLGGQALSDVNDLGRARAETLRLIRRERSERQGDVAKVSAAASVAQSTADTARGEVQAVRDTLAGEQAGEPDLLAQLVAVNAELQRLGQDPQPSLMLAFVSLSTALWEAQHEINAQQQLINEQQALINRQAQEIDAAQSRSIELLSLYNHGALFIPGDYTLPTKSWTLMDFSGTRGQFAGCAPMTAIVNGASGGAIRLLSAGDWEINARYLPPPGDFIGGTGNRIRVVVYSPDGRVMQRAESRAQQAGPPHTLTVHTTVSAVKNCYVVVMAYATTTSSTTSFNDGYVGPELSELSVRQLSVAV